MRNKRGVPIAAALAAVEAKKLGRIAHRPPAEQPYGVPGVEADDAAFILGASGRGPLVMPDPEPPSPPAEARRPEPDPEGREWRPIPIPDPPRVPGPPPKRRRWR